MILKGGGEGWWCVCAKRYLQSSDHTAAILKPSEHSTIKLCLILFTKIFWGY
jgi:hypothetical protein